MRSHTLIVSLAAGVFYLHPTKDLGSPLSVPPSLDTGGATQLLNQQPGFFVPNLGQWDHAASFAPASSKFAPKGYYVLFLVTNPQGGFPKGTPSVATWVQLK